MIGEEVDVNEDAEEYRRPIGRVIVEIRFEEAPCLCEVAADGRIHESGEEGNRGDLEERFFGIAPRADEGARLVELQHGADEVEEEDRLDLVPRFDFGEIEDDLQRDGAQKEEVVSGEAEEGDMVREKKECEKGARKDAGTCLLDAEDEEVPDEFGEGEAGHLSTLPLNLCCRQAVW